MGRKGKMPGLRLRNGIWHISKSIRGYGRIFRSTGTSSYQEAEKELIHLLEEIRKEQVYGIRPEHIFREAATKYLIDKKDIADIATVVTYLRQLDPFIGDLPLGKVHDATLKPFVDWKKGLPVEAVFHQRIKAVNEAQRRRREADPACPDYYQLVQEKCVKDRTVNAALSIVRRILNLAAESWRDDSGQLWLSGVPKLTELRQEDEREPYPLSWEEQDVLFDELPEYLRRMSLFKVNSGTREQEVCGLQWDWEVMVPELGTTVFKIPRKSVKNRKVRWVVLNDIAREIIESCRGDHSRYVFVYTNPDTGRTDRIDRMNNRAWRAARLRAAIRLCQDRNLLLPPDLLTPVARMTEDDKAFEDERRRLLNEVMLELMPGFANVRVHDLKHTFGRRLRAAKVSLEDRKALLGHFALDITTHYSAAEIDHLVNEANKACIRVQSKPTVTTLQGRGPLAGLAPPANSSTIASKLRQGKKGVTGTTRQVIESKSE